MSTYAVIITAAGHGRRFGRKMNKAFAKLQDRALLLRALELFVNRDDVCQNILVAAPHDMDFVKDKFGANLGFMGVELVVGGERRCQSVANGLAAVGDEAEFVAVHDAARVCTTQDMIDRVFDEATKSGAAILAAPLSATLKRVSGAGAIEQTVSREGLFEAQTPQVFKKEILVGAYAEMNEDTDATDDAEIVAAGGHDVTVVESDLSNIKITFPGDLALAGAILKSRPKAKVARPRGPFEEAQW